MRDLAIKIDFLADLLRSNNLPATMPPSAPGTQEPPTAAGPFATEAAIVPTATDIPFTQEPFAGSMDMAYSVDNCGDLEMLWPPIGNMPDQWWFHAQPPGLNGIGGGFPV